MASIMLWSTFKSAGDETRTLESASEPVSHTDRLMLKIYFWVRNSSQQLQNQSVPACRGRQRRSNEHMLHLM